MLLITGAGGQLGSAVVEACRRRGIAHRALSKAELDVTDARAVSAHLAQHPIECILNCAAFTDVQAAQNNPAQAYAVNAHAPRALARTGVSLIHVSTDFVFDGLARTPYETDAPAHPLSVYGASKRAGECALLEGGFCGVIVRTAWLYSKGKHSRSFYAKIREKAARGEPLRVVSDQTGSPTLAGDLADALLTLYEKKAHHKPMHIVHFTNAGSCTRFEFARAVVQTSGLSAAVEPIASAHWPAAVKRPAYSVLSLKSLEAYGMTPRHWLEALRET